jgi:phosphoserine phosphatase RsbU/P
VTRPRRSRDAATGPALAKRKRRGEGGDQPSQLASLHEITVALGSGPVLEDALSQALGPVLRELRAARGAFFLRSEDGAWALRGSQGLPAGTASSTRRGFEGLVDHFVALGAGDEAHDRFGLVLLVPIRRRGRVIAVLGLGPREAAAPYAAEEQGFLRRVAMCVAAPLENALLYDELRRAQQKLSVKVFELHNLFDISRELTGSLAEATIPNLVLTTVMGHFLVSRCAVYLRGPGGLSLACGRGPRRELDSAPIPLDQARGVLEGLTSPRAVSELPAGPLRQRLEEARLALAVPLSTGERIEGVLAIGERASGLPFSDEDREIARTLAQQAMSALENARLQRVREEKQRQDRELQVAREIQRSLLPARAPELAGFELAGESRPCYEVGGDSYDWIRLGDERLALVIADVSGKGTPASLLMASVSAFVHALAGTAEPARAIERLNRFLFARTQASRFVTLFYAELDLDSRRLAYVNAGHVPPFRVGRNGSVSRLAEGGPALGLLPEADYAVGDVALEPGDVIAMVTDGVTEAMSPEEHEFGDDRVCDAMRTLSGGSATAVLAGLFAGVDAWAGGGASSDDLTAVILKVR